MPTIDLGPVGAVLSPAEHGFADTAGELERLGFSTIWLTGGPLADLSQITDVVRSTTRVAIATGIIPVDRFPSTDVGDLYTELERDHPGRFVVGLGGAHGPDPLATLEAYLDRLEVVPQERRVLAALGPKMLDLAARRAAGAFPVLVTPEYVGRAKATLGATTTLAVEQLVVLEEDPDRARRIARGPLGFLGQLPAYRASFRRMGFGAEDIASTGDTLVDGLVTWGGVGPIAARVDELVRAGADHVAVSIVSASPAPTLDEWRAVAAALVRR